MRSFGRAGWSIEGRSRCGIVVIDRTCARCGCRYELGVHLACFGERVGLTAEQRNAIVHGGGEESVWSEREKLLIRLVDELHDSSEISDALWGELKAAFSVEPIFELIALVGFYHTVSLFANGLRPRPEPFAAEVR
jgi:4-carboxymuconolactone decarboxylase